MPCGVRGGLSSIVVKSLQSSKARMSCAVFAQTKSIERLHFKQILTYNCTAIARQLLLFVFQQNCSAKSQLNLIRRCPYDVIDRATSRGGLVFLNDILLSLLIEKKILRRCQ